MRELVERLRAAHDIGDGLEDDPDCLADMPGCFSVFRFRYPWGTVYEVSLATGADADDRNGAFGVLPGRLTFLECVETETLGAECGEFTLRFLETHNY